MALVHKPRILLALFVCIFVVVLIHGAGAAANKQHLQKKSQAPSSGRDDFTFDDEDLLVAPRDEPFESSGDGPSLENNSGVFDKHPVKPTAAPTLSSVKFIVGNSTRRPQFAFTLPDYDWELLPPIINDTHSDIIPVDVCGRNYHCRKGQRGPCQRNEIFTTDISGTSSSHSSLFYPPLPVYSTSCTAPLSLMKYGCVAKSRQQFGLQRTSYSLGFCRLRFPTKPCYGYPSSYRYCKRTKRCYPCQNTGKSVPSTSFNRLTLRGPCSVDQIFTAVDTVYGQCRCKRPNHVLYKLHHRCYPAFTKGPCSRGHWLVPSGTNGFSTCKPCPCPSMADGLHIFWNSKSYRPGCYKSYTRGPCRPGMHFVIDNFIKGSARCVYIQNVSGRKSVNKGKYRSPYRKSYRPSLYSLLRDWPLFAMDPLSFQSPVNSYDTWQLY